MYIAWFFIPSSHVVQDSHVSKDQDQIKSPLRNLQPHQQELICTTGTEQRVLGADDGEADRWELFFFLHNLPQISTLKLWKTELILSEATVAV